jgi:hypothetical protein
MSSAQNVTKCTQYCNFMSPDERTSSVRDQIPVRYKSRQNYSWEQMKIFSTFGDILRRRQAAPFLLWSVCCAVLYDASTWIFWTWAGLARILCCWSPDPTTNLLPPATDHPSVWTELIYQISVAEQHKLWRFSTVPVSLQVFRGFP